MHVQCDSMRQVQGVARATPSHREPPLSPDGSVGRVSKRSFVSEYYPGTDRPGQIREGTRSAMSPASQLVELPMDLNCTLMFYLRNREDTRTVNTPSAHRAHARAHAPRARPRGAST